MTKYFILIFICFSIGACTSKPTKKIKTKTTKKYNVQKTVQPKRGFLIEGNDQDNAINNLFDRIIDLTEDEIALVNDGKNPPYYNRLLSLNINDSATVFQVNQALKRAGVLISFSEEKSSQITVLVPPPGGIDHLKKYQATLEKSKSFDKVGLEFLSDDPEPITTTPPPN